MSRKKRKTAKPTLPLIPGEVWEVGQRPMTGLASVPDGEMSELPTMFFVVDITSEDVIFGAPLLPDASADDVVEGVRQAMHTPLSGTPRRPDVIRVSSAVEADMLRTALADAEITIEVTERLTAIDTVRNNMLGMLGHIQSDYRTNIESAGKTLSDASLHALYSIARQFYRKALWENFDDSEILSITVQSADGTPQTLYGVLMGIMGEEFGLALYASLEDLQRIYEADIDALEQFQMPADHEEMDEAALASHAEMTADLLSVPSLSITYTSKQELPQPLLEEAKALKLSVAKQSAYPFMMRTGQGMQLPSLGELHVIFVSLHAILDWDKQVEKMDLEDELDETLTVEVPAMADAFPALTAEVTLIANPFAEDDDFGDDLISIDVDQMQTLFDPSLFKALTELDASTSSTPKGSPKKAAKKSTGKPSAAKSDQVYNLKVFLTAGPVDEFEDEEISREIHIQGHHTLHDLHLTIFDAFEREESHLYEFNLGSSPADRSKLYFYSGGWGDDDDDTEDPTTATLDELSLSESQYFGYTFDMGDQWEHVIEVLSIQRESGKRGASKGKYPRIVKKIGSAPPQYPNDDEWEDEEEFD